MELERKKPYSVSVAGRAASNADLIPWCVHILGPDDLIACESFSVAERMASEINQATYWNAPANEPNDILCFAYAAPWPHSIKSHAENLAEVTET